MGPICKHRLISPIVDLWELSKALTLMDPSLISCRLESHQWTNIEAGPSVNQNSGDEIIFTLHRDVQLPCCCLTLPVAAHLCGKWFYEPPILSLLCFPFLLKLCCWAHMPRWASSIRHSYVLKSFITELRWRYVLVFCSIDQWLSTPLLVSSSRDYQSWFQWWSADQKPSCLTHADAPEYKPC